MSRRNQVDPHSQLHAVSARGIFMGNRGCLHNNVPEVVSQWKNLPWITCTLSYTGPKRKLMRPNHYTELFFLDEPTSYAAGHRPCAQCRRPAYNQFKKVWASVFPQQQDLSANAIDNLLHAARLNADDSQRTWRANLADLPDGSMIEYAGDCVLLWHGEQWRWSFTGYTQLLLPIAGNVEVTVLTPEPLARLFAAGLADTLDTHPTANVVSI